ncbi:hypothetical protein J6590_056365 [Homalodisca vitripennis]|nr:hypothetical protein J6590_056365 [Homalodisca vitripennis]
MLQNTRISSVHTSGTSEEHMKCTPANLRDAVAEQITLRSHTISKANEHQPHCDASSLDKIPAGTSRKLYSSRVPTKASLQILQRHPCMNSVGGLHITGVFQMLSHEGAVQKANSCRTVDASGKT